MNGMLNMKEHKAFLCLSCSYLIEPFSPARRRLHDRSLCSFERYKKFWKTGRKNDAVFQTYDSGSK